MRKATVWYKCENSKEVVHRVFDRVISVVSPNHGRYIHIFYSNEDDIKCMVTYPTHFLVEVEEEIM